MESELEKLGLTEQERKVYISCLKLGSAKASTIAEYSKIERQASYYILRILIKKGMISQSTKSGVAYYSCAEPSLLLGNIEEERKVKEEAIKNLEKEYKKFKNIALEKPKVEIYEGIEGFKTAAREIIEVLDKEVYSYTPEKIVNFRRIFTDPYEKSRIEKKIKVKVISEETDTMLEYNSKNKKSKREMRFMDSILKGKDYCLAISKEKVIFLRVTDKDQVGIKIEDPYFAEFQANIFRKLWEQAKPAPE